MKNFFLVQSLILMIWMGLGMACNQSDQKMDKKVLKKGPYLGQTAPGKSPELFAPGLVSTGAHEMSITISKDLNNIYVCQSSINWTSSIVMFQRGKSGWEGPVLAPFLEGIQNRYTYPFCPLDNHLIYYNSSKLLEGEDIKGHVRRIWISRFENGNWGMPELLKSEDESVNHMTFPSVSKKGNIYFNTTLGDSLGKSDIYWMKKTDQGYGKPLNLGPAVNSAEFEFHPYISPDEDYLIFDGVRTGGFGSNDLYISFKTDDGIWTKAVNMGEGVNTRWSDMRPYISPDGRYLFFSSTRPWKPFEFTNKDVDYKTFSKIINGAGNGTQDIYWMDSEIIGELKKKVLNI